MRILGVVILLFPIVLLCNAGDDDPHASHRAKCRDELGLTDQALKDAMPEPENMGCYLFCFFKETTIMNEKGDFDPEVAVQTTREDLREAAKPIIYACYELSKETQEEEACSRAYEMIECFKTRSPKMYMMLGIFQSPAILE